jgi:O-antigen/teichoic acid export membrane protein
VSALTPWIYAACLVAVWYGGALSVSSAALAWASGLGTGGVLGLVLSIRAARLGPVDRALLLETIRFGMRLWIGTLSSFINLRVDQLLMGFISTKAMLGAYAVAVNVSEVLLYFPQATADALFPALAVPDDRARTERALRAARLLTASTAASVVVAAVAGPSLIPIVFGSAFEVSVVPFLLLLPGAFGYAASRLFSTALATSAAPGRSSIAAIVSVIVEVALDLILIPRFGAAGAAVAASVAFLAVGATALALYRARNPFSPRELLPHAADAAAIARPMVVRLSSIASRARNIFVRTWSRASRVSGAN